MKRRAVDPDEIELWRRTMRGVARRKQDDKVAPGIDETNSDLSAPSGDRGSGRGGISDQSPPPHLASPSLRAEREKQEKEPNPGLDRRTALRLRRGQMPIEARLDLHGMTQEAAHRELAGFIARAAASGKRSLLIITGKGSREGGGVLRAALPRWLAEPALRARVLALAPAQPKDGGGGAFYLLLRRER